MSSSFKNILIGAFVVLASLVLVFTLLFLHPSVGDKGKTLHVRFTDIDKINVGTRVTYAGKPVGEVVSIVEIPEARKERVGRDGDVYIYELLLQVDSSIDIYNTDRISSRTSGLLGEKNIEINPCPLEAGQPFYRVDGEVLYAIPAPSMETAMEGLSNLSKKMNLVLEDIDDTLQSVKKTNIIPNIAQTSQNLANITSALNQTEKWQNMLDHFASVSEKADLALTNICDITDKAAKQWPTVEDALNNFSHLSHQAIHSWEKIDHALESFQEITTHFKTSAANIKQMVQATSEGKGSLGELFVGDQLCLSMKALLSKGERVMDDVHRYGILFHLNKERKKREARRQRLLQRFSQPGAFLYYFQNELHQISTSLSNVAMILDETEACPETLFYSREFSQSFTKLLNEVEAMEKTLNLYNEQLSDPANACP